MKTYTKVVRVSPAYYLKGLTWTINVRQDALCVNEFYTSFFII